jgi:hypothetical protein
MQRLARQYGSTDEVNPTNEVNEYLVGPPHRIVYGYRVRPSDHAQSGVAGFPAPPKIAAQIYDSGTDARKNSLPAGQSPTR